MFNQIISMLLIYTEIHMDEYMTKWLVEYERIVEPNHVEESQRIFSWKMGHLVVYYVEIMDNRIEYICGLLNRYAKYKTIGQYRVLLIDGRPKIIKKEYFFD